MTHTGACQAVKRCTAECAADGTGLQFQAQTSKTKFGPPLAVPMVGGYPNERLDTRKNLFSCDVVVRPKGGAYVTQTNQEEKVRNVVLVHGGFVGGSGWECVYNGESHPFVKGQLPMRNSR
jgi:hypothetical protein